jgi:hypothetical protein
MTRQVPCGCLGGDRYDDVTALAEAEWRVRSILADSATVARLLAERANVLESADAAGMVTYALAVVECVEDLACYLIDCLDMAEQEGRARS